MPLMLTMSMLPRSPTSGSMWTEARTAMLLARLRDGQAGRTGLFAAREALEMATRGGAACLGRAGEIGELTVGACGDIAVWRLDGFAFAGAWSDPIEAWLRCGPVSARHTIVAGRLVVESGELKAAGTEQMLHDHRRIAIAIQSVRP